MDNRVTEVIWGNGGLVRFPGSIVAEQPDYFLHVHLSKMKTLGFDGYVCLLHVSRLQLSHCPRIRHEPGHTSSFPH